MSSEPTAGAPARTRHGIATATALTFATAALLGLSGSPALANPLGCGDRITQDTTVRADLTNCEGDGLVIGADNITLDLNGHTIDGDKTGATDCELRATGVSNPDGHDGVTVENGTVRQFGQGIDGGFGRSRLRNLMVRDNRGRGIGIGAFDPDSVDGNRITHNLIERNGCGAINVTGADGMRIADNRLRDGGVDLIGVNHSVVERNSASGSGGAGIFGFDANENRIEHNTVSHNQDGVFLYFSRDNEVRENAAWANYFGGVSLKASSGNRISENATWDNPAGVGLNPEDGLEDRSDDNVVSRNVSVHDGVGVLVLASDRNRIDGNRALRPVEHPPGFPIHGGYGIEVDGGNDNVMSANTVARPALDGIRIAATPDWGGTTVGNALRENVIRDAGSDAVFVAAAAAGTLIEGNLASGAADDGFDVRSPASRTPPTTLTRNRALRNASLGIRAGLGVTDGGGNRARGNGDPEQCTGNIACA
jgi:parallel beta-helix repeat protein